MCDNAKHTLLWTSVSLNSTASALQGVDYIHMISYVTFMTVGTIATRLMVKSLSGPARNIFQMRSLLYLFRSSRGLFWGARGSVVG
jgi:hypothetical protein